MNEHLEWVNSRAKDQPLMASRQEAKVGIAWLADLALEFCSRVVLICMNAGMIIL